MSLGQNLNDVLKCFWNTCNEAILRSQAVLFPTSLMSFFIFVKDGVATPVWVPSGATSTDLCAHHYAMEGEELVQTLQSNMTKSQLMTMCRNFGLHQPGFGHATKDVLCRAIVGSFEHLKSRAVRLSCSEECVE